MTTLPHSLVRFRAELESAIGREHASSRRSRRRSPVRAALVTAAVAAVAVGALTALPGGPGGGLVEPASAAERAASALAAQPGSIVHVKTLVTQQSADGSRTTWREESWQQTSPPYDVRRIVTGEDGKPVETATPQPASGEPLREQVLDLLRSGRLTRSGRAVVDGAPTVSFTWSDGNARYEYTVDAETYAPVRWRIAPDDGTSTTTVAFEAYEVLPDSAAVPGP